MNAAYIKKIQDPHELNKYGIVCLFTYNGIKLNYEEKMSILWQMQ